MVLSMRCKEEAGLYELVPSGRDLLPIATEDRLQRLGVHDVGGGRPTSAGGGHRQLHVPEPAHGMGVGGADDLHAGSKGVADVLAAKVEPVGEAVDLERDPFLERDLKDALEVESVLRPPV